MPRRRPEIRRRAHRFRPHRGPALTAAAERLEVALCVGDVPERLDDATWTGPLHEVAPGRVLLNLPGVARALVEAEGVTLQPHPGADPADVKWFTTRPVGEAFDLLGGRFALRAASVTIDGSAIALVGHGASGKSMVAAALAQRGHGVLADSALPVALVNVPTAHATTSALELWPVAVDQLALDPDAGAMIRPSLPKRKFGFAPGDAAPLRAIVSLDRQADVEEIETEHLAGGDAIEQLHEFTAGTVLLDPLDLRGPHFLWMAQLANAGEVIRVRSDRHRTPIADVADVIEALVAL